MGDAGLKREKSLDTALREYYEFMSSHLQGMLQNGILYRLSTNLGQKWSFLRPYVVRHPAHCTFSVILAYLPKNVVPLLAFTKRRLPTTRTFVLNDVLNEDSKVLSEQVGVCGDS